MYYIPSLDRYHVQEGQIEMKLYSKVEQDVYIEAFKESVHFYAGESIHTENSFKYSFAEIEHLANSAQFRVEKLLLDSERKFSLSIFTPNEKVIGYSSFL